MCRYKFFTGEPVVPFGYGLSYSTWAASVTGPLKPEIGETATATYELQLSNKGPFSGDRVVLLFASPRDPSSFDPAAILPVKVLADYYRVRNAPIGSTSVCVCSYAQP